MVEITLVLNENKKKKNENDYSFNNEVVSFCIHLRVFPMLIEYFKYVLRQTN